MLSLEQCREILGADAPGDDRELEQRRDEAYQLARLVMEIFQGKTPRKASSALEDPLAELPEIGSKSA
jgi:hypothetical protein